MESLFEGAVMLHFRRPANAICLISHSETSSIFFHGLASQESAKVATQRYCTGEGLGQGWLVPACKTIT